MVHQVKQPIVFTIYNSDAHIPIREWEKSMNKALSSTTISSGLSNTLLASSMLAKSTKPNLKKKQKTVNYVIYYHHYLTYPLLLPVVLSVTILTVVQPSNTAASELSVTVTGRLPTNNVEVGSQVPLFVSIG